MAIATALLPTPTERAFLTLERVLTRAAISAARTAVRLGAVARRHEVIEASARAVEHVIGQIRAGLAEASSAAASSAQAAERVVALTSESRVLSARSLDAVDRLVRHGENSDARLQQLLTRVQEVGGASRLIDDLAVKTRFLALNATIEASRAGPAGRTFAVVANEVRELANSTADKTRKIQDLVKAIIVLAQPAREDLEHRRVLGETAVGSMLSVDQQLSEIHMLARQTSVHANDIARVIDDEHRAIGELSSASAEVATAIAELRNEAHQLGQTSFRVSAIADEGFRALSTINVETAFHRGLTACEALAGETGRIFGRAVDRGQCSLEALLALRYDEIKGPAIAKLARLFDVSRVPVTGFIPPKYHTGYDAAIDRELQLACDAIVDRDPGLLFALAIDLNSYAPIHNRRFMQGWTGEPAKDLSGNRVKRFFTDNAVLVRGARVGLPPAAAGLSDRATREDFHRAGAKLSPSSTGPRTFMCQTYARDTGALVTVVTVPIYVHGHRWGASLVGWPANDV